MSPTPHDPSTKLAMRTKCRPPSGYADPSLNFLSPGLYFNDRASKGHSDAETDSSDITMGMHTLPIGNC